MAYSGSTQLSSLANPPIALSIPIGGLGNVGGPGGTLWLHKTTDSFANVSGADYFSDGYQLGMKTGDPMLVIHFSSIGSTDATWQMGCVGTVSTSTYSASLNELTS